MASFPFRAISAIKQLILNRRHYTALKFLITAANLSIQIKLP